MTLITSYITKFGIIQASDSNLTGNLSNAGFGQKVFPIPHLNACLAYSGSYSINGERIDNWMTNFITGAYFTAKSIVELTSQLAQRMETDMRDNEISEISIVHIVGYTIHNDKSYVEHWHISNTGLNLEDGSYSPAQSEFHVGNDFNTYSNSEHKELLKKFDIHPLNHQQYVNGFPAGRMSSMVIKDAINEAFNYIWSQTDWKFRPPNNLFEFSNIVQLYFDFVKRLFPMSDYSAMYIGGDIQMHLLPMPQNIDKE